MLDNRQWTLDKLWSFAQAVGSRLIGRHDRCTVCDSVVHTMWFCIVVPIVPLDRYRVIRLTSGKYIGRMLKKSPG